MKKILFALGLVIALGAGCAANNQQTNSNEQVSGDWYLAFDLPNGWVMVEPYSEPFDEEVVPKLAVDRDLNEVYLQSSDKAISAGGAGPNEDVPTDSYVALQEDHARISVSRLDLRRVIPSEAEELKDGFYRLKVCEDNGDCRIGGRYNYDYYLKTETANYKFIINADADQIDDAEKVIRSAQVVTVPAQE